MAEENLFKIGNKSLELDYKIFDAVSLDYKNDFKIINLLTNYKREIKKINKDLEYKLHTLKKDHKNFLTYTLRSNNIIQKNFIKNYELWSTDSKIRNYNYSNIIKTKVSFPKELEYKNKF